MYWPKYSKCLRINWIKDNKMMIWIQKEKTKASKTKDSGKTGNKIFKQETDWNWCGGGEARKNERREGDKEIGK